MIEQLMVKDYILFDHAIIDFQTGISVITGETGAGKSLLIDAIGYVCGNRIPSNIVRKDKDKCILQMVLSKPNERICNELEENGFDIEEELIIQRIVYANGKSSIRINMQATTLGYVRQLTSQLIDVHSQMDTYQLMDERVQLNLLDSYANTVDIKNEVEEKYSKYASIRNEFEKAKNESFSDDELDYYTALYNEIENSNIEENELEELQEKIKQATSFQKNIEDFSQALYLIDGENNIADQVYSLYKVLSKNELFSELSDDVYDEYHKFLGLSEELKNKKSQYETDVDDLDSMQEREYFIKKLYRKHGGNYSSMMNNKEKYMKKIDLILHRQDVFDKLEKQQNQAFKEYTQVASKLSKMRKTCFEELSEKIEHHCKDLMLEKARFQILWNEKDPSKDGIDHIEFQVSMNPGSPFTSLKKSASGGELSRLMLALKVVFQAENGIETIVFDEIDTGVSGKVAKAMGAKMRALSKDYQVLCITHLSSVACYADDHYCVSKQSNKDQTITSIQLLSYEDSIKELAVMANGKVTDSALQTAKELKESTRNG